jgi:hypothetical protein
MYFNFVISKISGKGATFDGEHYKQNVTVERSLPYDECRILPFLTAD